MLASGTVPAVPVVSGWIMPVLILASGQHYVLSKSCGVLGKRLQLGDHLKVKAAFRPTHVYIPRGHIPSQVPTLHRARGFFPPSLQAALLTAGMG